jgi:hypothetical protein
VLGTSTARVSTAIAALTRATRAGSESRAGSKPISRTKASVATPMKSALIAKRCSAPIM